MKSTPFREHMLKSSEIPNGSMVNSSVLGMGNLQNPVPLGTLAGRSQTLALDPGYFPVDGVPIGRWSTASPGIVQLKFNVTNIIVHEWMRFGIHGVKYS